MALIKSISGIRGTIGGYPGEGLTPVDVVSFAGAYGAWVKQKNKRPKVVIGRDARPSGTWISDIIIHTLRAQSIDVVDLGLSTTPTVEIAVVDEKADGGIIITASHNPQNWNALKLLDHQGEFLSGSEGRMILELAEKQDFKFEPQVKIGSLKRDNTYIEKHIKKILDIPLVDRKGIAESDFRIAIDCVNSTGGIAVPLLLKALGVEKVTSFNIEPDGQFPHNPEPVPENLNVICSEIENGNFDLGLVVDPDVDRLAIITEDGTPFGEEYTLVAVADYVLSNKSGSTVSNLSSTKALKDVANKHGSDYYPAAVGEVNVVKVMKETRAVIGGEGNGGVIYPDLHYGRDAMVVIALFLSHLAKFGKSVSYLRSTYPSYFISKNKIELTPDLNVDEVFQEIRNKYVNNPVNEIDGIKIEFEHEWVHLRKSNTEPIIRIIAESDMQSKSDMLANKLISDIKEIITANSI